MTETTANVSLLDDRFHRDVVRLLIHASGSACQHHGYYLDDEDNTSFPDAMDRLTRLIARKIGLQAGENVLDVGCGPGQPALLLAREFGCAVTGVNIRADQVDMAKSAAVENNLVDRVDFHVGDAAAMPLKSGQYDVALLIDSVLQFPDKGRALREVARCLGPGGRLVLTDLMPISHRHEPGWLAETAGTLPYFYPVHVDGLVQVMGESGFDVLEVDDLTKNAMRTVTEELNLVLARRAVLVESFGEELFDQVVDILHQVTPLVRGRMGYTMMTARKSAS